MSLIESYKRIKESIVHFVPKYIRIKSREDELPAYAPIIGTGFVVRGDGLIATNRHVVQTFDDLFRTPEIPDEKWPVIATLYHFTDQGIVEVRLEVLHAFWFEQFKPAEFYYGPPEGPDMAFVQVNAKGLPAVALDEKIVLQDGMDIATAGFTMGTDALTAPGYLHQISPTLQKGIVSAVLPFECAEPHAFMIDVMTQGGASGSPVFLPENGKVVGMLYGGLVDIEQTSEEMPCDEAETPHKHIHRKPTSLSYVVPSYYLADALSEVRKDILPSDAKTIEQMIASTGIKSTFEEGARWVIRQWSPKEE